MTADIRGLVEARSVGLVGASDDPASFGYIAARNLLAHSEAGPAIYLITSRHATVLGRPTFPTIDALPPDVRLDVILVLVPANVVPDVIEQAARRGARYAVIFSGGFREVSEEGRGLEQRIVSLASEAGMRLYGPNTPGLMRFAPRLGMTIQPGFSDDRSAGPIGLIAQSGGLGRCVMQSADRGLGFSYFFSPGNQIDLTVGDFVQFLAEDPATKVIATLLEGLTDADVFVRGADAARAAGKPLVVLKLGSSQAGQLAALSHTGSLAGSDRAFDAFCRSRNIIRVGDIDELVAVCALLSHKPSPRTGRVGIYGMSGGAGVLAVDALSNEGVEIAKIDETTRRTIAEFTGSYLSVSNPVDISGPALSREETFRSGLDALARDRNVGAVLVLLNAWYDGHTDRFARAIASIDAAVPNLIVPVWMSESTATPFATLDAAGIPPVRSIRLAARAVAALSRYEGYGTSTSHEGVTEPTTRCHDAIVILEEVAGERIVEPDAKRVLAAAGICVTREQLVQSPAEAIEAADRVGYPVVLKAISQAVVHREREGLVCLDLRTADEVMIAYRSMHDRFTSAHRADEWAGMLVSEMVGSGADVFLGVTRDPAWGPLLAIGPGGAYADESDRVVLVALPASAGDVRSAILRAGLDRSISRAVKDASAATSALVDAAQRLASVALSSPDLIAIDLNPLRLRDDHAVALDAFMHRTLSTSGAKVGTGG